MVLTMRGMPFQPAVVPWSLQFTSVKAICNVAGMGAVFPGTVFVDTEGLTAMTADDLPIATMLNQFWVGIPPFRSASIRAENSAFPSGYLNQRYSAAFTHFFCAARLVRNCTAQGIPFAVGLDCIYGQSHKLSDFLIAVSLCT